MGTGARPDGATEVNPIVKTATAATPSFVCVSGPSAGRSFLVSRSTATVGRHPTNDFVIEDPRVSGAHLELTRAGDRVRVRDVGTTNGTWLGANRVVDVELAPGAELTIGDSRLRLEVDGDAPRPLPATREAFGSLVGASPAMRELFTTLERIAPKELGVLVQGERGTGKEEVARAIHAASRRASGPFVIVDTNALPEARAEAALFGSERVTSDPSAASDGRDARPGFLEAARGGTLFLDDVGELPAALQAKLARVLERRELVRTGRPPVPLDVRVVASTERDLRNAIDASAFQEDLYYRLAQVRVFVPPLRQRSEDLPLLAAKLLARASSEAMIASDALEQLATMPWPGNVRELDTVLLRAAALAQDGVIRRKDIAGEGGGARGAEGERGAVDLSGTFAQAKERSNERFEKAYLTLLMKRCQGNLSAASRASDVTRHHLRDLLKKRGLYGVTLDDE